LKTARIDRRVKPGGWWIEGTTAYVFAEAHAAEVAQIEGVQNIVTLDAATYGYTAPVSEDGCILFRGGAA
jgi:hypothetical protein